MMRMWQPLVIVSALALVACGGNRKEAQPVDTGPAERTTVTPIEQIANLGEVQTTATTGPEAEALRAEVARRSGFEGDVAIKYPEGGVELEATYEDGVKNGPWKKYHANGQVFEEGAFVGGEKHGSWVTYYADGQKLEEGEWEHGQPIGVHRAWLPDGTLIVEVDKSRGL